MSLEDRGSVEGKYTFDVGDPLVLSTLRNLCRRDPEYASDRINSVYFDTATLALLDQKINSEFLKNKVRLRWYGAAMDSSPMVAAYLEIKRKEGAQRFKVRKQFDVKSDWLLPGKESLLELGAFVDHVADLGWSPSGALFPMIVIRYFRHRFTEPVSRARISLDSGISYSRVNGAFFPETEPRALRHGVLEIKSETGEIPSAIMAIKSRINTRDSFSKYEECWNLYASTRYRRELTSSRYD